MIRTKNTKIQSNKTNKLCNSTSAIWNSCQDHLGSQRLGWPHPSSSCTSYYTCLLFRAWSLYTSNALHSCTLQHCEEALCASLLQLNKAVVHGLSSRNSDPLAHHLCSGFRKTWYKTPCLPQVCFFCVCKASAMWTVSSVMLETGDLDWPPLINFY